MTLFALENVETSQNAKAHLCDRDHVRVVLVEQIVGQHQIEERVGVRGQAEVLVVIAGETVRYAVRMIEHGRDAVEAEAVELVLVHPEANVGQEKASHLHPLLTITKLTKCVQNEDNKTKTKTKITTAYSV